MVEVREGVYWFKGYVANSYLIKNERGFFLFDVPSPGMVEELAEHFPEAKLKVFITHYHFDHMAGILWLDRLFHAEFVFPPYFSELVEGKRYPSFPPLSLWLKNLPKVWKRQGFKFMGMLDIIRSTMAGVPFVKAPLKVKNKSYKENFDDVVFIHTPGHTPESTCYIVGDVAVTGDTILAFSGKVTPNPFCMDEDLLKKSFQEVMSKKPSYVLPGHGEPTKT